MKRCDSIKRMAVGVQVASPSLAEPSAQVLCRERRFDRDGSTEDVLVLWHQRMASEGRGGCAQERVPLDDIRQIVVESVALIGWDVVDAERQGLGE